MGRISTPSTAVEIPRAAESLFENGSSGEQLETDRSSSSSEEDASKLEIEKGLPGGIRSCKKFNGSAQPKAMDLPHSHRKLIRVEGADR